MSTTDLDNLTDQSIDAMADPSAEPEHFAEDTTPGDASQPSEGTVSDFQAAVNDGLQTDKAGDHFDPEQHATDDDGQPKLTKAGYWAKKRGRKSGSGGGSTLNTSGVGKKHEQRSAEANHVFAGKAMASAVITMGRIVSTDFEPVYDPKAGVDERRMLEQAFAEYAASKEMDDIPPGVALTMALVAYAAPRFQMPATQSRMQRFSNWAGAKFLTWKNRRDKKKPVKSEKDDKKDDKKEEA